MSAQERVLRKITIDYTDTGIFGVEEIEGYVECHLHELDGSKTILIRTPPTHNPMPDVLVKQNSTEEKE